MATSIVNNKFSVTGSPDWDYIFSVSLTRTSNSQIRVNWELTGSLQGRSSETHLGIGYGLDFSCSGGNGSSGTINFKSHDSEARWPWSKKISGNFTASSSSAGNNFQITIKMVDQPGRNTTKSGTFSKTYTLTTPALLYTACSPPSNVKAAAAQVLGGQDEKVVTPAKKVNLTWIAGKDGTNNTINRYYIQQNINGQGWTDVSYNGNKPVNPGRNATSQILDVSETSRGYRIKYRIRAEGSAGSSYYSSYVESNEVLVNTRPVVANIFTDDSKVSKNGSNSFFVQVVISDSEFISQTVETTLTSNITGFVEQEFTGTGFLSRNISIPQQPKNVDSCKLTGIAYDGYEYSDEKIISIKYNIPSSMNSINLFDSYGNQITEDADSASQDSKDKRVLSIRLNYSATNPDNDTLIYHIERITSSNRETVKNATQGYSEIISTSSTTYTDNLSDVNDGDYIKYRIRVYDGYDYSDYVYGKIVRKNKRPPSLVDENGQGTFTAYYETNYIGANGSEVNVQIAAFEDSAILKWEYPNLDSLLDSQEIVKIKIERANTNSSNPNDNNFTNWATIFELNYSNDLISIIDNNGLNNLNRDQYVYYRISLVDDMETESIPTYCFSNENKVSKYLRKNQLPSLSGLSINGGPNFKIYDLPNGIAEINWGKGSDIDMPGISSVVGGPADAPHRFKIQAEYDEKLVTILENGYNENGGEINFNDGEFNRYSIKFWEQNGDLRDLSQWVKDLFESSYGGTDYIYSSIRISITPIDFFGVEGTPLTKIFTFDFTYPPFFKEETYSLSSEGNYVGKKDYFKIYKVIGNNEEIVKDITNLNGSVLYKMIDSGTKLKFQWPKVLDYNGEQTISDYIIGYYYTESEDTISNTISTDSFLNYKTIERTNVQESPDGYCYYETSTTQNININRVVKFCIHAVDQRSQTSIKIEFPCGIELCRLTNPTFSLNEVNFSNSSSEIDESKLSINWSIFDYGGSNFNPSRGRIYPNDRRNLEVNNSRRNVKIEVFVADNLSELQSMTQPSYILYEIVNEEYEWEKNEDNSYKENAIIDRETINNENLYSTGQDHYIKLRLTVNNEVDSRSVDSNYLILRSLSAPFSFRKLGLGLNNENPEGRFHASPRSSQSNDKDTIIFGGNEDEMRFIFDLVRGRAISGIIDCGDIDLIFGNLTF